LYNNSQSRKRLIKTGVPQGGVLSPILFNLYLSDLPTPPQGVKTVTYADDITPLSTHVSIHSTQNQLQPYLDVLHKWTNDNQVKLNPDKCSATLFTPAQPNTPPL
jgi:retron-type reverse transcriptase